jgi:hypothetical protein
LLENYIEANNYAISLGGKSRLFKKFTGVMIEIKNLLQLIRVTPSNEDKHFNAKEFVSVWDYFQFYI